MKRALVILMLAAGIVLVSPSAALACSCKQASVSEQLHDADTVVVGTVQSTTDLGADRTYIVAIDSVFKGKAGLREKVHSSAEEASCGLGDLATDEPYVFFLQGTHPGRLTGSLCGGTSPYGEKVVTEVQEETGGPFEPMPTYVTDAESDDGGPDRIRIVGIGAFVLAAIAGSVLLFRRRFRPGYRPRR